MKQFFFSAVLIAVPVVISASILYMFFHGLYVVIRDWLLRRELQELEREFQHRHADSAPAADESDTPTKKVIPNSGLGQYVDLDSLKIKEPTS